MRLPSLPELIAQVAITWRKRRVGHLIGKKLFPKITARRETRRAQRKAERDAAGGEFLDDDKEYAMFAEVAKSLVRHFGSAAAGAIVATGATASTDEASIFVNVAVGLVIFAVTQGWSLLRKVKNAPRG
jgi:hypothetical protein